MICTLGIGWLLWALTTAGKGQTPAKKLLSLTVVDERTHKPLGTGRMFWMRGILAVIPTFAILLTLEILWSMPLSMPLWDSRNQNLVDKCSSAVVLKDATEAESPPAARQERWKPRQNLFRLSQLTRSRTEPGNAAFCTYEYVPKGGQGRGARLRCHERTVAEPPR